MDASIHHFDNTIEPLPDSVTASLLGASSPLFALKQRVRSRLSDLHYYKTQLAKRSVQPPDLPLLADFKRGAALSRLLKLDYRLDNISLIDHVDQVELSSVRKEFESLGSRDLFFSKIFGQSMTRPRTSPIEPEISRAMDALKDSGIRARVSEHMFRICQEFERCKSGWYVVFNTLTVSPEHYDAVFAPGSTIWRDYVRDVDRAIGVNLFGSVREADAVRASDPFHSYFGVVECASRLHIHVLHFFRDIPASWQSDPNIGLLTPNRREIDALKEFWQYGHSSPKACRFADFDAFGKLGWRWPVEKPKGSNKYVPIKCRPGEALGKYVTKYITKSYEDKKGTFTWRTRMSRNFGLLELRKRLNTLPNKALRKIILAPMMPLQVRNTLLPAYRLKVECMKISLIRLSQISQHRWTSKRGSMTSTILRLVKNIKPQPRIVARLRSSMTNPTTSRQSNSTPTSTPTLKSMADSDFEHLQLLFDEWFPPSAPAFQGAGNSTSDYRYV